MAPEARRTVLAIDAGSPVASVALAKGERILAESRSEDATSSRHLLEQVDAVLREAGCALPDLGGVVALRGPGSFTGLRVGMATVLGLHQATGVPATALPTLTVLASLAPAAPVLAAVDALRGLWFHQRFDRRPGAPPSPLGEPVLSPAEELPLAGIACVSGFGAARLARSAAAAAAIVEPRALAGAAAVLASDWPDWEPSRLTEPLYLRPAPARAPGDRSSG